MAKRKQIVKFLKHVSKEERKNYTKGYEDYQIELSDFQEGVLFGIDLAREMIKNKRDKDHDYF